MVKNCFLLNRTGEYSVVIVSAGVKNDGWMDGYKEIVYVKDTLLMGSLTM